MDYYSKLSLGLDLTFFDIEVNFTNFLQKCKPSLAMDITFLVIKVTLTTFLQKCKNIDYTIYDHI